MKSITVHHGVVSDLKRRLSSINGNPRFQFVIDGYTVVTGVDSMHGYSIQNLEGKHCRAELGVHYGQTTLKAIREQKRNGIITSARTEWNFKDHNVNPKIFVTIDGGNELFLFDYYPTENGFRTDQFVGLTVEEAKELKNIQLTGG